jgi:tRNA A-37 threonylcarbamoyl transferase component Bud32
MDRPGARMTDAPVLATEDWHRLNRLLKAALELDDAQARAAWLAALPEDSWDLKPLLERLLAREDGGLDGASGSLKPVARIASAAIALALQAEQPGERIGPWRLERLLAEGGMGSVWLAQRADGVMQRSAALKLPRAEWVDRGLAERIARERDILARLRHPAIAVLYDAGVGVDGRPYLALEYVQGQAIDDWCRGRQPVEIVRLFVQVTRAVAYAHAQLVIHRDLKPGNLLVTPEGLPKLLDFGISKLLEGDAPLAVETALTRLTGRALTLAYAAPEQVLGEPVAVTADVYALGVVLFELLSGARLYRSQERREIEAELLRGDLRRPSDAAADPARARQLRGDLDAIVLTALKREPAQRYASAAALADDLERYLAGEPVRARPDSQAYRLRKFVGRHWLPLAAAAAVVLALASGLAVALWQAGVAREQVQRAAALNTFVLSLVRQADPNASAQTRAADVATLAAIEKRVDDEEARLAPDQLLEVRVTLGDAYRNRGEMMAARRVYLRAIDAAARRLPPDDLMLLTARVRASHPQVVISTTAAAQLGETIDLLRRKGREGAEQLIDALMIRYELANDFGLPEYLPPQRQFEALHEAHQVALATFGEGSRPHLRLLHPYRGLLSAVGEGPEGRRLLESALAKARQRGDDTAGSVEYLMAEASRASLLCAEADTALEGLAILDRSIAAVRAAHGPSSVLLESLFTLSAYCDVPDSGSLAPAQRPTPYDVFAIAAAREQPPSTSLLRRAMQGYGYAINIRDAAGAERFYRLVLDNEAAIPEPALRERLTRVVRYNRICQLAQRGDAEEALRLGSTLKPGLDAQFARLGRMPTNEYGFWVCLSDAGRQLERYADAEAAAQGLVERCIATQKAESDVDCAERALSALALVYLDAGQIDKARLAMARRLVINPVWNRDSRFAIAYTRVAIADGRAAEAIPVIRRVHREAAAQQPDSPATAEHLYWLGRALVASGDASGRSLVTQARGALAASPLATHRRLAASATH